MSRQLLASLAAIGVMSLGATGCHPTPGENSATSEEDIIDGQLSGTDENSVVKLESLDSSGRIANCTGTLVAPNLVITARHCVANLLLDLFTCDSEGNLIAGSGGYIGLLDQPSNVSVKWGATPSTKAAAKGVQLFAAEATTICRNDFALVLLDKDLDQAPYNLPISPIRLNEGVEPGEQFRMVGYGPTRPISTVPETVARHTRSGFTVAKVGSSVYRTPGDDIPPRTFSSNGTGGCTGDSGGPAFADSGAIIGVFSLFVGDCTSPATVNYFTEVAPFRDEVILPAFKAAGYEPWLENNSEPGLYGTGGSASTGGTAATGGAAPTGGAPSTGAGGSGGGSTIIVGSGGVTAIATSATGGAAAIGGAPVASGGAESTGGAPAQTGGSTAEVIVYDRGPSKGGSCGCRVGGSRGYGVGALAALAMVLGARRRGSRRTAT